MYTYLYYLPISHVYLYQAKHGLIPMSHSSSTRFILPFTPWLSVTIKILGDYGLKVMAQW